MRFGGFVKSRASYIVCALVAMCFIGFLMGLCQVGWELMAIASLSVGAAFATALIWDYARHRRFWGELEALIDDMEHAKDFSSFVQEPALPDQEHAYEALRCMAHVACRDVTDAQTQDAAYREYVETWVHEVKTPLASASLLAMRFQGHEGNAIACELERANHYIEQVLWYARCMNVSKDYLIRRVPLAGLARKACKQNARFLIEKGVAPSIDIDEDAYVVTDEKWALFIVSQAVVNAAKYGASSIKLTSNEHEPGTSGASTVLQIADDGWGICAADVPRVFDRGFTGERGRKAGSSTGMGLYLSALMASRLGLGLQLASEEGTGTRVLLSFPHDYRHLE